MKQPNNNNLLASIAVFAELCNTEKDIQGILTEFIKSTFAFEKSWTLDSTEVTLLLKKHFDFDLPEAVVRTCLNSLTKNGFAVRNLGKYSVIDTSYDAVAFANKLSAKKGKQEIVEGELVSYYESLLNTKVSDSERKALIDGFISYLLDTGVSEKYSTIISSFVLDKAVSSNFILELNQIKEGLVLLTGLGYTDDLNNIGSWSEELTIYLDTEHLFNSEGYNGKLYQKLFNDFSALVNEINSAAQKKYSKKLIHLKYFEEVNEEVNRFFHVAEKIIRQEDNTSPENAAMEEICRGCIQVSDVIKKKTIFETNLRTRGITIKEVFDSYETPKYNIEDASLLKKYKDQFDEAYIEFVLRSFTKVNFLRRGVNRTSFERCKHIILTGRTITRQLSMDLDIKNEKKDIPFATDIYFITNRLWYKLNKGLTKGNILPSTLDVITKARIVLSSQVNKSIDKKYDELKKDLKTGKINQKQAQDLYYNLRERAKKPEEINLSNLNESVEFIFENDLEKHLREKSSLEQKAREGEVAIQKLNKIESLAKRKKRYPKKIRTWVFYYSSILVFTSFLIGVAIGVWYLIKDIKTSGDTPIGLISFTLTIILEGIGLIRYFKPMHKFLKKKCHDFYLDSVKEIK